MNNFNPEIHHRKSIRLKGYDYSRSGLYFITICCHDNKFRFGYIKNNEMILNELGHIAYNEWVNLKNRFNNFELDVFQIMPNHIHGIIILDNVGAGLAPAQKLSGLAPAQKLSGLAPVPTKNPSISDIIGAYKSIVNNEYLKIFKLKNEIMGKLRLRNYYEHIIKNETAYNNISNYIVNNPLKWENDKFYIPFG